MRTAYLANIQDGVGERLISVQTGFLNDPAFRAAGWTADSAEIKRTYSPPIPTAVTSEYFQAPKPTDGENGANADGDGDAEGGMVTGAGGFDALRPVQARRRRRREQLEEDDSSDLSDESDEESELRPAGQIRFNKMPARLRAGSSPVRSTSHREDPPALVSSPAKLEEPVRPRGSSLGTIDQSKSRTRRDTTTSSEISADSDLDPSVFQRRILRNRPGKSYGTLAKQVEEDEEDLAVTQTNTTDDIAVDSDADSLNSDFSETLGPMSLLGGTLRSSPLRSDIKMSMPDDSPRKRKQSATVMMELPKPRPISLVQPVSILAQALQARNKKPTDPFERFASLSGAGDPRPLYLKIYTPAAQDDKPMEILIRKISNEGDPVTVAEAIGFSLWKYGEESRQPAIAQSAMNVNNWTFRIVEDEEVDYDFPPLERTKPLSDFTSNNSRAAARGRMRDKPWDEFALVQANEQQFADNEMKTPKYSEEAASTVADTTTMDTPRQQSPDSSTQPQQAPALGRAMPYRGNPITDPYFVSAALRKESMIPPADAPATATSPTISRSGESRTLTIHYTSTSDYAPRIMTIDSTTDTYLAEIFDQACKRLNFDKALYMFRVTSTTTIAPIDRTVEALGPDHSDLDLVRRRFGEGGVGTYGSPSSSSPNAPILGSSSALLAPSGGFSTPKKTKNKDSTTTSVHPLAQQHSASQGGDPFGSIGLALSYPATGLGTYKRYNVIRRQPMSLAPSHPRVLEISGEYMHIMPADPATTNRALYDPVQNKTTSVHFSNVVGCKVNRKHPKTFRVVIWREKESKRYDFEAASQAEADEIVAELQRGLEPYRDVGHR